MHQSVPDLATIDTGLRISAAVSVEMALVVSKTSKCVGWHAPCWQAVVGLFVGINLGVHADDDARHTLADRERRKSSLTV